MSDLQKMLKTIQAATKRLQLELASREQELQSRMSALTPSQRIDIYGATISNYDNTVKRAIKLGRATKKAGQYV